MRKLTKETKKKISESMKGKVKTKEHLDNLRKSYKKRSLNKEYRLKLSEGKLGELNPNYKDGSTNKKRYCKDCGKSITKGSKLGRCKLCSTQGKLNPCYIEDLIRDYPLEFNRILKEQIRVRDNQQCQICGILQKNYYRKLDVHHIDYDKDNLNQENLITLCSSCHVCTNHNREIYIEYFRILKDCIN